MGWLYWYKFLYDGKIVSFDRVNKKWNLLLDDEDDDRRVPSISGMFRIDQYALVLK
jgi:hypothetical protein